MRETAPETNVESSFRDALVASSPVFTLSLAIVACAFMFEHLWPNARTFATLEFGAHYGPRTFGSELWRLYTSAFANDSIRYAIFEAVALFLFGKEIAKRSGAFAVYAVFFIATSAANVVASILSPQIISCGATPGTVAVVTAFSLSSSKSKFVWLAPAVFLLAYLRAETSPYLNLDHLVSAFVVGFVGGAILQKAQSAPGAKTYLLPKAIAIVAVGLFATQPPDVSPILEKTHETNLLNARALKGLHDKLMARTLRTGEFSSSLQKEMISPLQSLLETLDEYVGNELTYSDWIVQERNEIEARALSLAVIRDVYEAKETLLEVQEHLALEPIAAKEKLDGFWDSNLPLLESLRVQVESVRASETNHPELLVALERGLKKDIADLTNTAVDLEIIRAENYLQGLRTAVLTAPLTKSSGRAPASIGEFAETDKELSGFTSRLEQLGDRVDLKQTRLPGLLNTLQRAREAFGPSAPAPLEPDPIAPSPEP